MKYVDGYVLPVPKKNLVAYRRIAQQPVSSGANMALSSFGNALATTLKHRK